MKNINRSSVFVLTLTLLSSALFLPAANAADKGYRYWGYFQAGPNARAWTAAMTGPTVNMADGSVEGWAFTFSSEAIPDAKSPRVAPDFTRICGTTKVPGVGKKRVGLVVDFGSAFIKPKGEVVPRSFSICVVVDKNALGVDVLSKVVKLRAEGSGLICSLNAYPAKECGAEITTPTALLNK